MCFPVGNAEALHETVRRRAAGQDGGLAQVRADSAHYTGATRHGLTRPSLFVRKNLPAFLDNFPVGQPRICLQGFEFLDDCASR
jgi:hypothetical protein